MTDPLLLREIAGWRVVPPGSGPRRSMVVAELLPEVLRHKLIGVLAAMIEADEIEVDDEAAVWQAHNDAMAACLMLEDVLLQAVDVLDAAGIEWRVLKGSALAHGLPADPSERSFGDNDLLVRGAQIEAAVEVLTAAGGRRLQPRVSPAFDRRFSKSITMGWLAGTELDLHRTLAPGPFGLTIDPDDLFTRLSGSASFPLAGRELPTLDSTGHLLQAAIHVALGDIEPRLGNVRDIAWLLTGVDVDADVVVATASRWHCELPVALGIRAAAELGVRAHPLVEWAEAFRPRSRDARSLSSYRRRPGRFRAQAMAALRVLPWRDRPAYLWSLWRRR